jgi:alkyl sulfatase BDS1-like metallo-beta-lactamase superfamily hydrolase
MIRRAALLAVASACWLASGAATAEPDPRTLLMREHPELAAALQRGGGFGGEYSALIANRMHARDAELIGEARAKTTIEPHGPRTWLSRMPWVNAVLFETDAGLVLVDAGYAPGGPAILDAIRSVSKKRLHSVIYTHSHADHAFGAWALLEAGEKPQIVAAEELLEGFDQLLRLRGSIAKYNNQRLEDSPSTRADFVWPTRTFRERLQLEIGGEKFVLTQSKGETDDQLYVWAPGRKALASADYYQGFLPNAGNGKRMLRDVDAWTQALGDMAALEPELLLPAHGAAIRGRARIREELRAHAAAFRSITEQTLAALNAGLRKDEIPLRVKLPPELASRPTLRLYYVSVADISRMVLKKYTGWWDDIPSHWSPAPLGDEARALVELAGGSTRVAQRARELVAQGDLALASHLADWAWYANPDDSVAQQLSIDVYKARVLDPASLAQERIEYLARMVEARGRQASAKAVRAESPTDRAPAPRRLP